MALLASGVFSFLQAAEPKNEPAATLVLEKDFRQKTLPLITKYCVACHGREKAEGDLVLSDARSVADVPRKGLIWRQAAARIRGGEMPPKKAIQPSAAERQQLAEGIEEALTFVDCTHPTPGRPTLRRLTRLEYRNSIRDLLGVDYKIDHSFPSDDVGHGFDNIGDVLTLPPMLLEKYLAAAEDISRRAIHTEAEDVPFRAERSGEDLETTAQAGKRDGAYFLYGAGELAATFDFPEKGSYLVQVTAAGDQAGDEPAKMALHVDGHELANFEVKAENGKPEVYAKRIPIPKGKHRLGVVFTNDFYKPATSTSPSVDRNLGVFKLEVRGPFESAKLSPTQRRLLTERPGDKVSFETAASNVLKPIASRAFRRPVRVDELDRLVKLASQCKQQGKNSFPSGVQLALQAILVSPHFLYKVELDSATPSQGDVRSLNDFEVATRLSYFLWSSLPDDELFLEAQQGSLLKQGQLEKQVRRMMRDPKASALVDNFAAQWLQLGNLERVSPDAQLFPKFNGKLRQAMRRETEMFVSSIFEEDRSVLDLITADHTYVNEQLAKHYGLPNIKGDEFRRVSLSGLPRGGLLTQASILTITSNPNRTSPVKRGRWILDNLLSDPPPPPAPDVPPLPEGKPNENKGQTLRQRLEEHRRNPQCASCHSRMDPLGFALENYDAIGAWRTTDNDKPIDSSGELTGGYKFQGSKELRLLLAQQRSRDFVRCITEKLLTYALGRGLEYTDRCAVNKMIEAAAAENHKFSRIVVEVVLSDPFLKRTTTVSKP